MASLSSLPQFGGAEAPAKVLPYRSIVDLIREERAKLPCWIEPAVLTKGGKWLIGGEAKIGKSFLCLEICRALATGTPVFRSASRPVAEKTRVLYIDQEVGDDGLRERVKVSMANEDLDALGENFNYVCKSPDLQLDDDAGFYLLKGTIAAAQPNVVVLDPASRVLRGDQSDGTVVRNFWRNIDRLIKDYRDLGLSFVVAHHFRKPPSSRETDDMDDDERFSPYRFTGSADWYNAPDTITTCIRASRTPGAENWLLACKDDRRHGAPGELLYLRVDPNSPMTVTEVPAAEAEAAMAIERATRDERRESGKKKSRGREVAQAESDLPKDWLWKN